MLGVFLKRSAAYKADNALVDMRNKNVANIEIAFGACSCANNVVNFIDIDNSRSLVALNAVHHRLQTLFNVATELASCYKRT